MSVFSMGQETYQVSVQDLFVAHRQKLQAALLNSLNHDNNGHEQNVWVYMEGGPSTTRYDSDHEPLFRQESYFWYLTGVKEPDVQLLFEVKTGAAWLLIPRLPSDYATIMGPLKTREEWKTTYSVDHVRYSDEWADIFQTKVQQQPSSLLLLLKGLNSDSGKEYTPPEIPSSWLKKDNSSVAIDDTLLHPILAECRVIKTLAELQLLRHVTEITSHAHAYVMRNTRPGLMEYQAESLFRHYCYYHHGCRLVGYTPICGCGPNAAILHYGHAGEPNARQLQDGNICLFDMGAEYFGYGSDVTCSFPCNGKFSPRQEPIYQAVLQAQIAVYNMMKPGVSYVDCHKAAELEILKGLAGIGLVVLDDDNKKTLKDLVEMRLGAVFMPHGLGHLIGIDTHDVGGYLPGHAERSKKPGLKSLRTARILQKDMTLTVEPGCYFIDHLLDQALQDDSPLRPYLNAERIQEYRGFGGVRLEDVVVVTENGCENYTLCPRTMSEVESVLNGGKWPPIKDEAPELRRVRLTDTSTMSLLSPPPFS